MKLHSLIFILFLSACSTIQNHKTKRDLAQIKELKEGIVEFSFTGGEPKPKAIRSKRIKEYQKVVDELRNNIAKNNSTEIDLEIRNRAIERASAVLIAHGISHEIVNLKPSHKKLENRHIRFTGITNTKIDDEIRIARKIIGPVTFNFNPGGLLRFNHFAIAKHGEIWVDIETLTRMSIFDGFSNLHEMLHILNDNNLANNDRGEQAKQLRLIRIQNPYIPKNDNLKSFRGFFRSDEIDLFDMNYYWQAQIWAKRTDQIDFALVKGLIPWLKQQANIVLNLANRFDATWCRLAMKDDNFCLDSNSNEISANSEILHQAIDFNIPEDDGRSASPVGIKVSNIAYKISPPWIKREKYSNELGFRHNDSSVRVRIFRTRAEESDMSGKEHEFISEIFLTNIKCIHALRNQAQSSIDFLDRIKPEIAQNSAEALAQFKSHLENYRPAGPKKPDLFYWHEGELNTNDCNNKEILSKNEE